MINVVMTAPSLSAVFSGMAAPVGNRIDSRGATEDRPVTAVTCTTTHRVTSMPSVNTLPIVTNDRNE
ncbi:hypothetical protein [Micromonospora sp. WMMD708]|uniref:hypothetical protein n=1 Tax=Micromonospora sp. WMMD708 TaxID=3403464 RepID=UPI003BF5713D